MLERENKLRTTPLHKVVEYPNQEKLIKALLKLDCKCDVQDSCGRTPLHLASERGHLCNVETLVESGADVNIIDSSQNSPLHYAVRGKKIFCRFLN